MVHSLKPSFPLTSFESIRSQHRHYGPEDGDSMFLRNVGILTTSIHGARTQSINSITIRVICIASQENRRLADSTSATVKAHLSNPASYLPVYIAQANDSENNRTAYIIANVITYG
jgi:hypothetical protein